MRAAAPVLSIWEARPFALRERWPIAWPAAQVSQIFLQLADLLEHGRLLDLLLQPNDLLLLGLLDARELLLLGVLHVLDLC